MGDQGRRTTRGNRSSQRTAHTGAKRLGENIARTPALVIPTIIGRHDGSGRPGLFESVVQAAWSFMVALRARGLGTVWTTMYLNEADAVAEFLDLPDDVTQICLFPVAYTIGTDFKATGRRYPARDITYFDRYGRTLAQGRSEPRSIEDGPGVAVETDIKAKPPAVWSLISDIDLPSAARWRFTIEQVPGGSRLRFHCRLGPGSSGLTPAIAAMPDREADIIARRQDEHRANMTRVVEGVKELAESAAADRARSDFPRLGSDQT